MILPVYLEFAKLSERNFGGIDIVKAESEVTTIAIIAYHATSCEQKGE